MLEQLYPIKIVEKKYRIGNPKLINVFTKQSIFLLRDILNYSLRYQKHALQDCQSW